MERKQKTSTHRNYSDITDNHDRSEGELKQKGDTKNENNKNMRNFDVPILDDGNVSNSHARIFRNFYQHK